MTYQIECKICQNINHISLYVSETANGASSRGFSHLDGLTYEVKSNVLFNHNVQFHPEVKMTVNDLKMTITGQYRSSIWRQTSEAILFNQEMQGNASKFRLNKEDSQLPREFHIMNSKSEFHQPKLIKSKFASSLNRTR